MYDKNKLALENNQEREGNKRIRVVTYQGYSTNSNQ